MKLILWNSYWRDIQTLEIDLNRVKEDYERSKKTFSNEVAEYKKMHSEHSIKLKDYVNQIYDNKEIKRRLDSEIETRKIKLDELEHYEIDNDNIISALYRQRADRKVKMCEIVTETQRLNEFNNDFIELESISRVAIKNTINSICQKKNWQREANVPMKSDIFSGNINKINQVVNQNRVIRRTENGFKPSEDNCRCVIF